MKCYRFGPDKYKNQFKEILLSMQIKVQAITFKFRTKEILVLPLHWHKRILEPIKYILGKEDIITIKHLGGGVSKVTLKSFGKARDKFQGISIDFCWE